MVVGPRGAGDNISGPSSHRTHRQSRDPRVGHVDPWRQSQPDGPDDNDVFGATARGRATQRGKLSQIHNAPWTYMGLTPSMSGAKVARPSRRRSLR
jgi:hypothetical protein